MNRRACICGATENLHYCYGRWPGVSPFQGFLLCPPHDKEVASGNYQIIGQFVTQEERKKR